MNRELQPIQSLRQEEISISNLVDQRKATYDRIGTGQIKLGESFEATLKVGKARRAVQRSVVRFEGELDEIKQEIRGYEEAQKYPHSLEESRQKLAQISELVAEGHLPEEVLRHHQREYENIISLPQRDPALQRGLDRIRQEESLPQPERVQREQGQEGTEAEEKRAQITPAVMPQRKIEIDPAATETVRNEEFGKLTREDISFLAVAVKAYGKFLAPITAQRGIQMEDFRLRKLIGLIEDSSAPGYDSLTPKEKEGVLVEKRKGALDNVLEMINEGPEGFGHTVSKIARRTTNVALFLIYLQEINEVRVRLNNSKDAIRGLELVKEIITNPEVQKVGFTVLTSSDEPEATVYSRTTEGKVRRTDVVVEPIATASEEDFNQEAAKEGIVEYEDDHFPRSGFTHYEDGTFVRITDRTKGGKSVSRTLIDRTVPPRETALTEEDLQETVAAIRNTNPRRFKRRRK